MSKRIKGITIELDGDTKGLDKALQGVTKESYKIQNELSDVNRLLKFNPKNTELLAQKQKLLSKQVETTRERLKGLKDAQKQVNEQFQRGEISESQYRNFQREIAETESKLAHYENQLKGLDKTQRSFADKIAESGKTVKEFGQGMTSVGKELSMKVTAPLVAIGGVATKLGMDFKAGLSEVQALSGATGDELMRLEERSRELGASTKFSAKQVTEGFKYMALAGWDVQQSLDGIDGVLALSAASGEDLGRVSDILTDSISAFGDEAKDAARYADVMAAASSNANTDVSGLGEAFKMVAPVAGALGFSLEDTSVALGLMANAGVKGSAAGTALRSALTNLVKPTAAMQKEMKKLGINVQDSNGEMKPLDVLLRDLRGSFGKLSEAEKASAAATIFGKEAMSGMLAVINAGEGDFNKLTKAIANSEGVAQEMADTMQNNLQGKLTNLKSALEELAIKIYDALEPALTAVVKAVQNLVDWLNGMDKNTRNTAIAIAALAAAVGPLLVVLGTMLTLVGGFMTTLPALLPLLGALAPPVAILVTTLTALAAAYALARPKAEEHYNEQVKLAEQNLELSKSYSEVLDEKAKQQAETSKLIESTKEEMKATDELVDSFEGLIEKSKLSTKELGQFLTLQTELEHTKSPQKIAEIEAEMEKLRNKSGLSTEEFNRMLEANDQLTDKFPGAGQVIDEYGNKIADTTGKLREMTQAELERMGLEVYNQMADDLRSVNEEIDNYQNLIGEVLTLEDAVNEKNKEIKAQKEGIKSLEEEQRVNNESILALQEKQKDASFVESLQYGKMIDILKDKNLEHDNTIRTSEKNIEKLEEAISIEKEDLKIKDEQRKKIEGLIDGNNQQRQQYVEMLELQFDMVVEQGNENDSIDKAIKKRSEEIKKLDEKIKKEGDSNGKSQEKIDKLEREKKQLDDAKTKLDNINKSVEDQNKKYTDTQLKLEQVNSKLLDNKGKIDGNKLASEEWNKVMGKKVDKDINVKTNKDPDTENKKWSNPITKFVNFITKGAPKAYADGTNYHPGGPAFLGDGNGPELVEHNGKMSIASFGLYDLPTGAKVHTYEDTISMLRNGLVDGIGRGVEVQRNGGFEVTSDNREMVAVLKEQNQLLKRIVDKDNVAVVDFEPFYKRTKERLNQDKYSQYKGTRRG